MQTHTYEHTARNGKAFENDIVAPFVFNGILFSVLPPSNSHLKQEEKRELGLPFELGKAYDCRWCAHGRVVAMRQREIESEGGKRELKSNENPQ